MKRFLIAAACALVLAPAAQARDADVRFSTFNASLNRSQPGELVANLFDPTLTTVQVRQAKNVAEVIQRIRPDVLLINEFDFAPAAVDLFRDNFLEMSQNGAAPIEYPYAFIAPSNTGIATGFDLNNNGVAVTTPGAPGYGDDSFGFGAFLEEPLGRADRSRGEDGAFPGVPSDPACIRRAGGPERAP